MIKNGWFYCDFCGKKAFPVLNDTQIYKMPFQCKNHLCPQRQQLLTINQDTFVKDSSL